jgi:Lecithin:cholesterol acyltransferase
LKRSALVAFLVLWAWESFALNKSQVPVIFVPGYAASAPEPGYLEDFIFQRGFSPERLNISPIYNTLIKTLESAGYENNSTLFKAAYDWRMSLAPTDDNLNGILENVTAKSITEGNYSYAVNYLGFWLNRVLEKHPDLQYVDVVTQSTGGDIARAYIQSPAYGALYRDSPGKRRKLPKIRNLILGAAPYFGTAHSFRPWGFQQLNKICSSLQVVDLFV